MTERKIPIRKKEPGTQATRDGFGEALVLLGKSNPNVVVLCADLAESTRTLAFKDAYPERYVEMGVAEQNLATVASGMAAMGKIPVIASYAAFSPGRNWEQIRTTIALNQQHVIIAGMHAGVSVGPDGATHQMLEDIGLMRMLPGMTVIVPSDALEAKKATLAAIDAKGPVYLRFSREKSPAVTDARTPFVIGKANVALHSKKAEVLIISTGVLLSNALSAAKTLAGDFEVTVLNMHTIKPLDRDALIREAKVAGAVVVVEEHQRAGGLGGAVAEALAETYPVPIEFVGVHDAFGQSGETDELMAAYELTASYIAAAARRAYHRKNGKG